MAIPRKSMNGRTVGEIMLSEVFTVVQRLNAAAGPRTEKSTGRSLSSSFMLVRANAFPAFCTCRYVQRIGGLAARHETPYDEQKGAWVLQQSLELSQE